jgi:hypothetical protein
MVEAKDAARPEAIDARIHYAEPGLPRYRRFVATGAEVNTFGFTEHAVQIRNGRPHRDRLHLDAAGFELLDHKSKIANFLDQDEVGAVYPAEAIALVKDVTGASTVAITNWNLRSTDENEVRDFKARGRRDRTGRMQPPGLQVHIDHYPDVAERLARQLYEEQVPGGPGYHRAISMSLWRTFSDPSQDRPLAVCESPSVAPEEGLRNTLVFVDDVPDEAARNAPIEGEETMQAATLFAYSPEHRWWFFPDMNRDEALLFKFHDSDHSGAWRVPHTAFVDRSVARPVTRKSIELRCTAYFER